MAWLRTSRTRRLATAMPRFPYALNPNWELAGYAHVLFSGDFRHGDPIKGAGVHVNLGNDKGVTVERHSGSSEPTLRTSVGPGDARREPMPAFRLPRVSTSQDYYDIIGTDNSAGYSASNWSIACLFNFSHSPSQSRYTVLGRDTGFSSGSGAYIESTTQLRTYSNGWDRNGTITLNTWDTWHAMIATSGGPGGGSGTHVPYGNGYQGVEYSDSSMATLNSIWRIGSLGSGSAPATNRLPLGWISHVLIMDGVQLSYEQCMGLYETYDGKWDMYEEYDRTSYFIPAAASFAYTPSNVMRRRSMAPLLAR